MTNHVDTPAVPPSPASGWDEFSARLTGILPETRVISDLSKRLALSTDASFYHKVPRLVLQIANCNEMASLLKLASRFSIPVTFRAAGTSLSGQAISDSVLIMLTPDWQDATILDNGERIVLQPGLVGAKVNRLLAPMGRKIGPDPASINTCKIGGIAANNASGMCCGVKNNSYHTLDAMQFILADGTFVDTADEKSSAAFRQSHAPLLAGLTSLAERLRNNSSLREKVSHQFRLKNTLGYGINALLDHTDPLIQLAHLMIGSEGTLGFIAQITYRTVPVPKVRYTGLYLFTSVTQACQILPAFTTLNVSAAELMDSRALQSVTPLLSEFSSIPVQEGEVALLVEVGGDTPSGTADVKQQVEAALFGVGGRALCPFTQDQSHAEGLWRIRKGLFPAVGAVRETGTTVIIEDVAFPLAVLAEALAALTHLFEKHNYHEAIIFGHALDGNVHFVFTQRFDTEEEIQRYSAFMDDVVKMVTSEFDGTLKAEHGTGRNMAPFLVTQWGEDGAGLMNELKTLIDPAGILNPGVIINPHADAHLSDLKVLPPVDPIVDKCIECGFCEPQCPSLNFTLSPRQRIALKRRQQQQPADTQAQIDADFDYLGIDSCAATGLCATTCPVGIDTGEWIKTLRAKKARHPKLAGWAAGHLPLSLSTARTGFRILQLINQLPGSKYSHRLNSLASNVREISVPRGGTQNIFNGTPSTLDKVIYFSTCPNRMFDYKAGRSLPQAVASLMQKAGFEVIVPPDTASLCCGQPWVSKGYPGTAASKLDELRNNLSALSQNGHIPIVFDASPCARQTTSEMLNTFELSAFLLHFVVPRLTITPLPEAIMLHTTCSSTHMDGGRDLRALASVCCEEIIEPEDITCCGFAGDKGFTMPALNASALAPLKQALPANCTRGISNSRTCEIGLSRHSGIPYEHIAILLDEVSQARLSEEPT